MRLGRLRAESRVCFSMQALRRGWFWCREHDVLTYPWKCVSVHIISLMYAAYPFSQRAARVYVHLDPSLANGL